MRSSRTTARLAALVVAAASVVAMGAASAPPASAVTGSYSQPAGIAIEPTTTGSNDATIIIPEVGAGSLYPSPITLSDVGGPVTDVNLTLVGLQHTCTPDLDLLLVGPGGQQALVMSDKGQCMTSVSGVDLTLDEDADAPLPVGAPLTSGTYLPGDNDYGVAEPDPFPAPAPDASGAGSALSVFDGTDPNGTWKLYVSDQKGGDSGQLASGWRLSVTSSGMASPYPSTITVDGAPRGITDVNVTLNGFDHIYPDDVDVLLVGPGGQAAILMSDAGGGTPPIPAANLTFDDEAAVALPDATPVSGSYRPANYAGELNDPTPVDSWPAPAPDAVGTGTALSVFDGTDPNGSWKLYVVDDFPDFGGEIAGGWGLQISTVDVPARPTLISPVTGSTDDDGVVTFAGAAPANTSVSIFDGTTSVASTTAGAGGAFSVALAGVANGAHTFTAKATSTDGFGNVSAMSAATTVTVDTVPPAGSVAINKDAARTNRAAVTLTLAATDAAPGSGVTQTRFSNDGKTFSAFEPFSTSTAWTLAGATNGTKTVWVQYADGAGKISVAVADSIVLDTVKPKVTRISPVSKATGVKVGKNVTAVLSEAVAAGTVTKSNVTLVRAGTTKALRAVITYDASTHKIKVNPKRALTHRVTYTVTIRTGVKDLAGNNLDQKQKSGLQAMSWRFTTI
jgi:subtilisin-like proprotein convertase family protein